MAKSFAPPRGHEEPQVFAPAATEDPTAWSNTQLQWINDHLKADGYDPVP